MTVNMNDIIVTLMLLSILTTLGFIERKVTKF